MRGPCVRRAQAGGGGSVTGAVGSGQGGRRYHGEVDRFSETAVVLDSRPYRERDLLLVALGEQSGVLRGVLRGARGRRHARGSAAAQVLSEVELEGFQRPSSELATFTEIQLLRSSYPLATELERTTVASAVAELLITFCLPGEPAPQHFRLVRGLLTALLEGTPPRTALCYALTWVLRLGGVFPDLETCSSCGKPAPAPPAISAATGHPLCRRCAPSGAARLDAAGLRFLQASRHTGPEGSLPEPPESLSRWLERLAREEAHRPLRTLDLLRRSS